MTTQELKKINLIDFLSSHNISPLTNPQNGKNGMFWYHSPLHEEKTPSFKVNTILNTWYDFGIGKGGSIIDFVMELKKTSIKEAINYCSHYAAQKEIKKNKANK